MRKRILVSLVAILVVAFTTFAAAQSRGPENIDDGILIEHVTLISPERPAPMPDVSVSIRAGKIAGIGKNLAAGEHAKRINGRGKFLIPGLMDSHVHVAATGMLDDEAARSHPELLKAFREQLPKSYLAFGFTTLVDLDHNEPIDWFTAGTLHPSLYHCGRGVHVLGSYGAFQIPKDAAAANAANIVYEPARAREWPAGLNPEDYSVKRAVDRVAAAGGICVKTFVESGFGGIFTWPVPRPETLAALRDETRRRGMVFIVHANGVDSWQAATAAHADIIAHGLWHWPGERSNTIPPKEAKDVIQAAAAAGVKDQPTMQTVYGESAIFDNSILNDPRMAEALPASVVSYLKSSEAEASQHKLQEEYRQAGAKFMGHPADMAKMMSIAPARVTESVKFMLGDGLQLLFGSDTPAGDTIGNPPGLNGRLELQRWYEAGVPLSRILRAATLDNAQAFGLAKDAGTIEVGKWADLLLLDADPLQDIAAYDRIEVVFLKGEPIARQSLVAPR